MTAMTATSSTLIFARDSKSIKKPLLLKGRVFYSTHQESSNFHLQNLLNMIQKLLLRYWGIHKAIFVPNKDEIKQFLSIKERPWIWLLSKSFFEDIVIKKEQELGFFVLKTDKRFSVKNEMEKTAQRTTQKTIVSNVEKG